MEIHFGQDTFCPQLLTEWNSHRKFIIAFLMIDPTGN